MLYLKVPNSNNNVWTDNTRDYTYIWGWKFLPSSLTHRSSCLDYNQLRFCLMKKDLYICSGPFPILYNKKIGFKSGLPNWWRSHTTSSAALQARSEGRLKWQKNRNPLFMFIFLCWCFPENLRQQKIETFPLVTKHPTNPPSFWILIASSLRPALRRSDYCRIPANPPN